MDFDQAVGYLADLQPLGIRLGLDRFRSLLAALGNPERACPVLHVAGTKGKGSVTAMAAAILQAHGVRTGAYLSPYVYDIRERVQLAGTMIDRERFAACLDRVAQAAETLAGEPDGSCTEFEVKTALAFEAFRESRMEASVVEVGLGGRLDATNVVRPAVCVITTIDYDHCDVLGHTLGAIASEKAGIIKSGVPLVTSPGRPTALKTIRRRARDVGAPCMVVEPAPTPDGLPRAGRCLFGGASPEAWVATPQRLYSGLSLGLSGAHQVRNAACAVAAGEAMLTCLGRATDPIAVARALAEVRLPGRMEMHGCDPVLLLDGAHNQVSAEALAACLRALTYRRMVLVVGMSQGHQPSQFLEALAPMAHRVVATQAAWRRALPAQEVARAARRLCSDVEVVTPVRAAVQGAIEAAGAGDLVLVTGSFYVVGEANPATFGYSD